MSLLFFTIPLCGQALPPVREVNFTQVDDVVSTFVQGLKNQDLEMILSVSAVNEMAEGFDFVQYCQRLNAVNLLVWKAPSTSSFYKQINRLDFTAALARQVRNLAYSLVSDEEISGQTVMPTGEGFFEKVQRGLDPSALSGLTLIRSDFPRKSIEKTDRYLKLAVDQARPFGAQESTERLVLVERSGITYVFGLHFLKYGKYWKIDVLCSYLGSLPATGTAEKKERSSYEADISE